MSVQDDLVQAQRLLLSNYIARRPGRVSRGEGCTLWDTDGRPYLDMTAGSRCVSLVTDTPGWPNAIRRAGARLIHASNLYI